MQTFLEVARLGSVTRAAQGLKVSQPAVTQQIRRLEEELGVRLLERRQGRLAPTDAGERVRVFARRWVDEYRELRRQLPGREAELRGNLRLGASTIPGEFVVPRVVAGFRELHPQVKATVVVADTAEVIDRLLSGEFHVGFVGAKVEVPDLVVGRLTQDELVLVVYPGHPFARRQSVRFEELSEHPLILREPGSGTMRSLQTALAEQGLELPQDNVVMRLGSSRAITSAVAAGLGIGFVSSLAVAAESPARLVCVPIEGVSIRRNLFFLYRAGRAGDRLQDEFVAFLRQWAGEAG